MSTVTDQVLVPVTDLMQEEDHQRVQVTAQVQDRAIDHLPLLQMEKTMCLQTRQEMLIRGKITER